MFVFWVLSTDFEPSGISVVFVVTSVFVASPVSSCFTVWVLVVETDFGSGFLPHPVTRTAAMANPKEAENKRFVMHLPLCNTGPAREPRRDVSPGRDPRGTAQGRNRPAGSCDAELVYRARDVGDARPMTRDLRVTSGDAELQVQCIGDAHQPCQLLVMGAQASMLWWPRAFCERLAQRGRYVVRFDMRDTGLSTKWPPGAPTYTGEDLADDLVAILDALGVARAHLAGVSQGGMISQIAALKHPTRFASLAVISATPLSDEKLPPPTPAFGALAKRGEQIDWTCRGQVVPYLVEFQRLLLGDDFDEAATRQLVGDDFDRSGGLAHANNHYLIEGGEAWKGLLGTLRLPVVAMNGNKDPVFSPAHGQAIARAVPGARFVALPGGHGLDPVAWDAIIDELMKLA